MQTPAILYEDKNIIVLDKPSGMIVNNSDTARGEETVQGWVVSVMPNLFRQPIGIEKKIQNDKIEYNIEQEFQSRGGIVHRLDKETSGILLVAKNPESFEALKQQFMARTVKKTYTALSHGKIVPENGEINAPVGRLTFNRTHFGVVAGGREAKTLYHVISVFTLNALPLTLTELYPQTGRTHQIRVHLKYLGYPIFSDELYAGRKIARDDRKYLPRLFLHASKVSFNSPTTGKVIEIESHLPQDLQSFLSNLTLIAQ